MVRAAATTKGLLIRDRGTLAGLRSNNADSLHGEAYRGDF
jgi:hypothetical protein